MQRPFIVCDPEKCTGCQMCEFACSARHGGYNPLASHIRLVRVQPAHIMSIACRLCDEPTCMAACPRQCISVSRGDRHHAGGQRCVQRVRLVRGGVRIRRSDDQPRRADRVDVQPVRGSGGPAALRGDLRARCAVPLHAGRGGRTPPPRDRAVGRLAGDAAQPRERP